MALLRENDEYIKADLVNYRVERGMIIVPLFYYKDKETRQYEKDNGENIKQFHAKISQYIDGLQAEINQYLMDKYPDAQTSDDFYKYEQEINADKRLQDKCERLRRIVAEYEYICDKLGAKDTDEVDLTDIELFNSFGFNSEWLEHPIVIVRIGSANIGYFGDKEINGNLIYTLMKERMPNTIDEI